MATIDEELGTGIWAIVVGGSTKYIGRIRLEEGGEEGFNYADYATESEFDAARMNAIIANMQVGTVLRVEYAQEFHCTVLHVQAMTDKGPTIVAQRNIEAIPVSRCLEIEKTTVWVIAQEIIFLKHMSSADRRYHQDLIATGHKKAEEARLAALNLVPPRAPTPRNIQSGNA